VDVESDNPERFAKGERLLVRTEASVLHVVTVESTAPLGGRLLVRFSGVTEREEAERMRGCHLMIHKAEAGGLGEGEYWIHELEGMKVVDAEGRELGEVAEVLEGPAQDLLLVRDGRGGEFQVPFVEEFVRKVDRDSSTVTVSLIDGMGPTGRETP
jgi:16S rRNA processing protein RimM